MPIEHVSAAVTEWASRWPIYRTYEDYHAGRHELKFVTPDWTNKHARIVLEGSVMSIRENLCPAVVASFTDAIKVASWGTRDDERDGLTEGLSRLMGYVKRESWKVGDAFVLVWPDADGNSHPIFQRARTMTPHVDPSNPDRLDWCAKIWHDSQTKRGRVNLYYPDRLERWETDSPLEGESVTLPTNPEAWRGASDSEGPVIHHTYGEVPVAWLKLDADDPAGYGKSILNDVVPLQDGLNSSLAHMLVNQEAYSRPFWYLLNFRADDHPANPFLPENSARPLRQAFDRTRQSIVTHDGPGPFGQLDPPDLTRLLTVQEKFKEKVCGVVGIPPYVMQGGIGNVPSGAALRTLERRRVARITSWESENTPALNTLKRLLGMGDGPIEWAPAIELDELERWQVAQAKESLGYSLEDILNDMGEVDVEGVVGRSEKSRAALAQAFMDGNPPATYR